MSGSGGNPDRNRRTWAGLTVMVDEDRWAMLSDLLVELASDPSTEPVAEEAVVYLLGGGRVVALTESIATRQGIPLLLRVFEAEVGVRLWQVRSYEIEALRQELEATGRHDLWLWATAIAAENYLWFGDLSAFTIASAALAGADDADERPFARLARGKLRRVLAIGGVFLSSRTVDPAAMEAHAAALGDFEAIGCQDEILATEVLYCITHAMVRRESAPEQLPRARAAAAAMAELRSDRLGDALLCWAWLGTLAWDLESATEALAQFDASEGRRPQYQQATREAVGLAVDMAKGSVAHFELVMRLRHLLVRLSARTVLIEGMILYIAGLALDLGLPELVGELGPDLLGDQGIGRVTHLDRRTVAARLRILEKPGSDAVEEFESTLSEVEATGPQRQAAVVALRGAIDCARVGLDDHASALYERGRSRLPADADLTARERHFVDLAASQIQHPGPRSRGGQSA